jgi:hypothetical protein
VLLQSIRPAGVGLVVGSASAAGLSALLLATPAAAPIGQIVHVLDPVANGASLLIIMAACLAAAMIPGRAPLASIRRRRFARNSRPAAPRGVMAWASVCTPT